jgi:hypothetical protein
VDFTGQMGCSRDFGGLSGGGGGGVICGAGFGFRRLGFGLEGYDQNLQ